MSKVHVVAGDSEKSNYVGDDKPFHNESTVNIVHKVRMDSAPENSRDTFISPSWVLMVP